MASAWVVNVSQGIGEELWVAPMAIADAYEALMAMETLSADDEKLLFEISLGLSSWNYRGLGSRATATMLELVELRGVDHFRPAVPDPGEA